MRRLNTHLETLSLEGSAFEETHLGQRSCTATGAGSCLFPNPACS